MLPTCLMCFDNKNNKRQTNKQNNQRGLGCKFYFDENYMIVYICLKVQQINCSKRNVCVCSFSYFLVLSNLHVLHTHLFHILYYFNPILWKRLFFLYSFIVELFTSSSFCSNKNQQMTNFNRVIKKNKMLAAAGKTFCSIHDKLRNLDMGFKAPCVRFSFHLIGVPDVTLASAIKNQTIVVT